MEIQNSATITELPQESALVANAFPTSPTTQKPQAATPRVTTSSSSEYAHRCALASSRATLTDPLNILFQSEKLPSKSIDGTTSHEIQELMYTACLRRLQEKLARSPTAFVAEAGDFAAVACWERENYVDAITPDDINAIEASGKPIFANFLRGTEHAKATHLYPICQQFWHLSLMARDPTVQHVPGAVRAVMVPFVQQFIEQDRIPVWIEAGSAQARDVYAHFGFTELEEVVVEGVSTWCMIRIP